MTPPNATRGYFDLIRARGVDDDGPQGSRATKGKGKQLDDRPRRLFDEPGLGSSSYDDGLEDDSPGPSIRVSEPRDYLHPGLARPASALVDRNESMMSSTLFVPRGGATSSTRSGTPSTMTVRGGSMTDGRNTPIRIPSPVPGPSPLQTNELSQIPHRSSSTRELMPYPAVSTSTTTTFPDWLRSRSRSSSSSAASIQSKGSQSTGSGSMLSLSGRIKLGMRSRLSFRDRDQVGSGSGSPGFTSAQSPVNVENRQTRKLLERKDKKDSPKGLMRRLMVRSKTSPLVVTTIHHHPVGHDLQTHTQGLKYTGPGHWAGKEEEEGMVAVPRKQQIDVIDMTQTRRAGETGLICPAQEGRTNITDGDTALEGTVVLHEVPELRSSSFETKLPREIRLLVFRGLVDLHVTHHQTLMKRGKWKGVAAQQRWYGETAGRRELFRLRSVSRATRSASKP